MKSPKKIWLSPPHMSGHELQYIHQAFQTNWISPFGPNIDAFEEDLESFLNENSKVVALSSGTAAIHLSLLLLNVEKGDEVICQSKTFAASTNPVVYQGATPVFVDSEKETWNICPEQMEIAIKDRISCGKVPKAIIAVHLYGMPYNISRIHEIAMKYDIPVVEDSAEALGSTYNGKKCGTFGDISILSFNGNKIITTSAGGALITKDPNITERAKYLANQAKGNTTEYHHTDIGFNYRMSNVLAGIGRGQLKVLEDRVKQRRCNYEYYVEHLSPIEDIAFQSEAEGSVSNRWLTGIILNSEKTRDELRLMLEKHNIESKLLWKPMHQQPIFNKYPKYLNGVSDELFKKGLCLPSGSNMTNEDLERVTDLIKSYFDV